MQPHTQDGVSEKKKTTKRCEECHQKTALYQCPRCNFRSCSLECCVKHKKRLDCNGKRDRTAFLRIRDMSDDTLRSDYHFLEDVLGNVESSKRLLRDVGGARRGPPQRHHGAKRPRGNPTHSASPTQSKDEHTMLRAAGRSTVNDLGISHHSAPSQSKWRHFQQQAAQRQVQLLFMEGLERHKTNHSYVKKGLLHWTIEWCVHSADAKEPTTRIRTKPASEERIVWDVLSQNADVAGGSSWNQSTHSLLIKQVPCPHNQPNYVLLSESATISSALSGSNVLEYPTIDVVPNSRLSEFPRSIESLDSEAGPSKTTEKNS